MADMAGKRPESSSAVHPDIQSLRVLAHPMRLRLLGLLRQDGPSTATRLAQLVDINSGAASYHLRQLADAGLIAEDTQRGTGRDRWWRAAHECAQYPVEGTEAEQLGASTAYLRGAAVHTDHTTRAVEELPPLPPEWQRVSHMSDRRLLLTADDVASLNAEIEAVLERYRSGSATGDVPEGARQVRLVYQAFPTPGAAPFGRREDGEADELDGPRTPTAPPGGVFLARVEPGRSGE